MTDQHPLTDEMCEGLMERTSKYPYTDDVIVDMRKAADWQLEQCIDWLVSLDRTHYTHLARLMRKAMRPQEDN